jgi:leucyl aminopeptidase
MTVTWTAGDPMAQAVDVLVVGAYEGEAVQGPVGAVDQALDGVIARAVRRKEFEAKPRTVWVGPTLGRLPAERVLVVGLGPRAELTVDGVRQAYGQVAQKLEAIKADTVAVGLLGGDVLAAEAIAEAAVEGLLLGGWRFDGFKQKPPERPPVAVTVYVDPLSESVRARLERGRILAEAANRAREMGCRPANRLTPDDFAREAVERAERAGLAVEVFDEVRLRELGMGGLLAVGQGSTHPPRMVVLRYQGGGNRTLALVGKGITFDSGGLSLKPAAGMEEMKYDMLGAAAVLSALEAVAALRPALNVVGILCLAENLPSGSATRPGDVVKTFGGKTIEITNTDAEGRVALADGVGYAVSLEADWIVDAATLTGAAIIVLGHEATALVATDDELARRVETAAARAGERVWRLPVYPEYRELYKSDVADLKNAPGRDAGTITGGLIISEFAGDTPFCHLDIAGTAWRKENALNARFGPTGVPVRTLVHLAFGLAGAD